MMQSDSTFPNFFELLENQNNFLVFKIEKNSDFPNYFSSTIYNLSKVTLRLS